MLGRQWAGACRAAALVLIVSGLLGASCAAEDPDPWAATQELLRVCADGDTTRGIDVSYWQGTIDWDRVAGAGVKFAFIRASHGLEGDTKFARNWSEARRVGIIRGTYHFLEPDLDIDRQASLFLDQVGTLADDDLPQVLDIEDTGGLSADRIVARAIQWIERVEAATGRQTLIYTGKYFWQDNCGSSDALLDHPLWIPQYGPTCPDLPTPWTHWKFFQTSSTGSIAGISGNVDLDLFNGTLADLRVFARGTPECGDHVCNGDETPSTCAMDCPVCDAIPADGRIVDQDEVCFEAGGPAVSWRQVRGGYGGTLLWTYTTDDATATNFCVWRLDFEEAGRYSIEVNTPAPYAESAQTKYTVRHGGVTDTLELNQGAVDGWQELGEVDFAAGASQNVRVGDNTGEPLGSDVQMVCDAIRLRRIDTRIEDAAKLVGSFSVPTPTPGTTPPEFPPMMDTPPPSMSGGCTVVVRDDTRQDTSGGLGLAVAALALGGLRRRGRRGRRR